MLSTLARGQFANKRAILKATGLPPLIKLLTDDRLQSQQYVIASQIASDYPPHQAPHRRSPTVPAVRRVRSVGSGMQVLTTAPLALLSPQVRRVRAVGIGGERGAQLRT